MKLLHIDSSILGENSASRELTAAIVARWRGAIRGLEIVHRDLDADPLPHLSSTSLAGTDPEEATQAADVMREFLDADLIVIGAPMYNFSVPSTLKAWIDRLAVAGKTFQYTASGPEGLVRGRQVVIASCRGGFHQDDGMDFQEAYLRRVFDFMGVTDVEFVRAEGLAVSPQQRSDSLAAAHASITPALAKAA